MMSREDMKKLTPEDTSPQTVIKKNFSHRGHRGHGEKNHKLKIKTKKNSPQLQEGTGNIKIITGTETGVRLFFFYAPIPLSRRFPSFAAAPGRAR